MTMQPTIAEDARLMLHWRPSDLLGETSLRDLLFSDDYRLIAIKGILTSLIMLALGGFFALTFRAELTVPDIQFFGARPYMGLMTLHGMFMVFGFVIPIVISICYYMLPKVMGQERLLWAGAAQGSFWTLIGAAALLIIGRPDFTWTFYAPMSLRVGGDLVWMGYVAIALVAVSDNGHVLLLTVVVTGHCAGPDVDFFAHLGVAHVAEVSYLGAPPET